MFTEQIKMSGGLGAFMSSMGMGGGGMPGMGGGMGGGGGMSGMGGMGGGMDMDNLPPGMTEEDFMAMMQQQGGGGGGGMGGMMSGMMGGSKPMKKKSRIKFQKPKEAPLISIAKSGNVDELLKLNLSTMNLNETDTRDFSALGKMRERFILFFLLFLFFVAVHLLTHFKIVLLFFGFKIIFSVQNIFFF